MLFYFKCFFLAFLISIGLQLIQVEGVSCAKKISRYIKQTTLGVYLNKRAQVGVFYIRKATRKFGQSARTSIHQYTSEMSKSLLRKDQELQNMHTLESEATDSKTDVTEHQKFLDQEQNIIFEGIKKFTLENNIPEDDVKNTDRK